MRAGLRIAVPPFLEQLLTHPHAVPQQFIRRKSVHLDIVVEEVRERDAAAVGRDSEARGLVPSPRPVHDLPQFRVSTRDSAESRALESRLRPRAARLETLGILPGFSIGSGTRIYDKEVRQGLCQYIVRVPLSMQKIYWDDDQDTVSWNSSAAGYFQGREMHFSCPRPAVVCGANGERRADGKPGRTAPSSAVTPRSGCTPGSGGRVNSKA